MLKKLYKKLWLLRTTNYQMAIICGITGSIGNCFSSDFKIGMIFALLWVPLLPILAFLDAKLYPRKTYYWLYPNKSEE